MHAEYVIIGYICDENRLDFPDSFSISSSVPEFADRPIMDDDLDLEPVRRFELKLLEGEMKVFVSNVYAALEGFRADFADLKTDLAKRDQERSKREEQERAKRDEERARQQNAREWRFLGVILAALGLAVVIIGLLIRLPVGG